jgi:hypothetical protein
MWSPLGSSRSTAPRPNCPVRCTELCSYVMGAVCKRANPPGTHSARSVDERTPAHNGLHWSTMGACT